MEIHEKRCFRNPNRFCDYCDNTGVVTDSIDYPGGTHYEESECPYCAKFDKKMKEEIEEREKKAGT